MEEKKKYLLKYVTEEQAGKRADKNGYVRPKTVTIEAETERAAMYALWTSKKGPFIDRIISATEVSGSKEPSPAPKYKVGWYDKNEKRRYAELDSKEEVLDLISDLMDSPGQISVKPINTIKLDR